MNDLFSSIPGVAEVRANEPLSRHTTFQIGGPCDVMVFPETAEALADVIRVCSEEDQPYFVLGKGSNVLVSDQGIRGVVIATERLQRLVVDGTTVTASAGLSLINVSKACAELGLSGLEFASGIPGTLGGGCAMNAGAYGGELKDVLVWADVLLDGELHRLSRDEMEMGYRSTMPLRRGAIVVSACFELQSDDPEAIQERMRDLANRRREKQPLNLPSAGSTFKRPEGHFAGALIEQCELKGCTIGGAQVSEKHAGFIVNVGDATAADILNLIEHVQRVVRAQTGVHLETEVRVLGEN